MKTQASPITLSRHHRRRPVYFMIKPDTVALPAICDQRRRFGIDERYDAERLHSTVLPLCDASFLTLELLGRIDRAVAAMSFAPFRIEFDRLVGITLQSGSARNARSLRRELVRWLIAFGVPTLRYDSPPHLTLAYGDWPQRIVRSGRSAGGSRSCC